MEGEIIIGFVLMGLILIGLLALLIYNGGRVIPKTWFNK